MLRRICSLLICWVAASGVAAAGAEEPGRLKILYAGNPGSDRERDYVGFLKGTFARVDSVDYRGFREDMADGHDVVIFDWTSIIKRDAAGREIDLGSAEGGMNYPKPTPHPSENYSRPTILIGGAGERVIRPLRLKIDWGCLCLQDHAHGMKAAHPIFRGPFPVDLRLEEVPTPGNYRETADGRPVGPTIQAWRVQTPRFFDADPGLVARGDEFEEAPDAEAISSGINAKTPEMVALGRQGNYFLWGFASPPSEMTPDARNAFLNAVCYIQKFDGRRPVVRKAEGGTITLKSVEHAARFAPIAHSPDGLREAYPHYATYDAAKYQMMREMELGVIRKFFPDEVNARGASDPGAYLAWVEANRRRLMPGAYDKDYGILGIAVDEDLKALGLGNHEVATLDACIALLAAGDPSGRALRVLKRYTGLDLAGVGAWKDWLGAHRDRLIFTEVGGWRFVAADSADVGLSGGGDRLPLSPPGPARAPFEPVKLSGSVEPARASAGQVATVTLRVEIAPRWHIATKGGQAGSEYPINLQLALPAGVEAVGDWVLPGPTFDAEGHGRYEGTAEFRRQVRITAVAKPGPARITPGAAYQACDPASCRPATLKAVDVPFEVAAP